MRDKKLDGSVYDVEKALRFNTGKLRYSQLSTSAIRSIVEVLEFGATKYPIHNWRKGFNYTVVLDSIQRHLEAFKELEDKDKESGLSHIAHVLTNAMFLQHMINHGTGVDDRIDEEGKRLDELNKKEFTYVAKNGKMEAV
jgi:hypothetical protein